MNFDQNNFSDPKNFFDSKNFFVSKNFATQKKFDPEKFLIKIFSTKILFRPRNFCQTQALVPLDPPTHPHAPQPTSHPHQLTVEPQLNVLVLETLSNNQLIFCHAQPQPHPLRRMIAKQTKWC